MEELRDLMEGIKKSFVKFPEMKIVVAAGIVGVTMCFYLAICFSTPAMYREGLPRVIAFIAMALGAASYPVIFVTMFVIIAKVIRETSDSLGKRY